MNPNDGHPHELQNNRRPAQPSLYLLWHIPVMLYTPLPLPPSSVGTAPYRQPLAACSSAHASLAFDPRCPRCVRAASAASYLRTAMPAILPTGAAAARTLPPTIVVDINNLPPVDHLPSIPTNADLTVPPGQPPYAMCRASSQDPNNLPTGSIQGREIRDNGWVIAGTWYFCLNNDVRAFINNTAAPHTCVLRPKENGSPGEVGHMVFAAFQPAVDGQGRPDTTRIVLDARRRPVIQLFTAGITSAARYLEANDLTYRHIIYDCVKVHDWRRCYKLGVSNLGHPPPANTEAMEPVDAWKKFYEELRKLRHA